MQSASCIDDAARECACASIPAPPPPPSPGGDGLCESTCYSYTCDDWVNDPTDDYTCSYLELEYGCDCNNCDCVEPAVAPPSPPLPPPATDCIDMQSA